MYALFWEKKKRVVKTKEERHKTNSGTRSIRQCKQSMKGIVRFIELWRCRQNKRCTEWTKKNGPLFLESFFEKKGVLPRYFWNGSCNFYGGSPSVYNTCDSLSMQLFQSLTFHFIPNFFFGLNFIPHYHFQ